MHQRARVPPVDLSVGSLTRKERIARRLGGKLWFSRGDAE